MRLSIPLFLFFVSILSIHGLAPRKCQMTPGASEDKWLGKKKCYYCSRTVVIYMESITKWKTIHEEAGCADEVDMEETPPGLDCASHLGTNSSGRGSDFTMFFTARGETELIARRCCENFYGDCNAPFDVKYPQKYLLRHIRRSPPKLMGPVLCCIIPLMYILFRIYYAGRTNKQMSYDVTKKQQLVMFGYKDDNLEMAIYENRTKVEEPVHAVRKAHAIPTFNEVLRAIFDIQHYLDPKKYDTIWIQALPKMRRDAEMRGLRKPLDTPPPTIVPIPDRSGQPFYELKKAKNTIFAEILKHQTISSKILKTQNRPVPSCMPDLLLKLIEHGPYEYPFKAAELFQIFEKAKDQFAQDPSVLNLRNNQIVIGDIRGRYIDIFRYFNAFGWPPQRSYLFLGGIIENEEDHSLECMALLAALKTAMPNNIFILRGVGETVPYVPAKRFPGIKGEVVGNALARLCNNLPLSAVINNRILCTHSGVTTHFKGKNRLNNIQRPFTIDDMSEAGRRIIFAVPETNCRMFRMRPHEKNGEVFGSKAVQKTLANMKLDLLIRSRTPISEGYCLHWDNSVLSIWSALSHGIKRAAAVEIDPSCRIALHLLDTLATLTTNKNERKNTNNVKVAAIEQGGIDDEDYDDDEELKSGEGERSSSPRKEKEKRSKTKSKSKEESAKAKSEGNEANEGNEEKEEDKVENECSAQAKTASDKDKKETVGPSGEKTTMKGSKEASKEQATNKEVEKEEKIVKTQDSLSARAIELTDRAEEQNTQSVKEWKVGGKGAKDESKKKEKKKAEEEPLVLKTPDISFTSHKEKGQEGKKTTSPVIDDGKSGKKNKNVKADGGMPKSLYDDAIPKEELVKEKRAESVMKDVSVRKKEVVDKPAIDSIRGEKTKKGSNETLLVPLEDAHPKEDYAISEKSMGSTTKKGKKEDKKEKKEEKRKDN